MDFVVCMARSYHLFIYYGLGAGCLNIGCIPWIGYQHSRRDLHIEYSDILHFCIEMHDSTYFHFNYGNSQIKLFVESMLRPS